MTSAEFEKQDAQVIDFANRQPAEADPKLPPLPNSKASYRKSQLCALARVLVEIAGYLGLGGVMLAGLALSIVPLWAAVPVFTGCFIWAAIRFDRFFREEW